jgi:aspartate racemase
MKTIGMIGGLSWESTANYYRDINSGVKARLGGLHSAKIVMNSVDFAEIEVLQHEGRWQEAGDILSRSAVSVEKGGADFLILCTNTMHKVSDQIQSAIHIPFMHIADATAEVLRKNNVKKVGLLGTRFTMEDTFYRGRLESEYQIEVETPDPAERDMIHRVIYEELCQGQISDSSRQNFLRVIDALSARGVQGVILGCTEIAMLVSADDTNVPLYDTARIHTEAAVAMALA